MNSNGHIVLLAQQRFRSCEVTREVLSVFDFDGTLTRHDSFVPFLFFAYGAPRFAINLLKLIQPGLRYILGQLTRDELKARLVCTFLTGTEANWLRRQAQAFCHLHWGQLMRPSGLRAVTAELQSGAMVTLCSASPTLVLQPFADRLGVELIGTQLEINNGILTGRLVHGNCRGKNKVAQLVRAYGPLEQYWMRAWGDSPGDYALLDKAQEPHWQHFHSRWR
ncbi:HAD-IB family phosphatase [Pseudomonas zeae]|uniref:HAD-IB family phosphatase n=1 Tax=Pseudomonas zeae TaxID=2745510 RepID=UPI0039E0EF6F